MNKENFRHHHGSNPNRYLTLGKAFLQKCINAMGFFTPRKTQKVHLFVDHYENNGSERLLAYKEYTGSEQRLKENNLNNFVIPQGHTLNFYVESDGRISQQLLENQHTADPLHTAADEQEAKWWYAVEPERITSRFKVGDKVLTKEDTANIYTIEKVRGTYDGCYEVKCEDSDQWLSEDHFHLYIPLVDLSP